VELAFYQYGIPYPVHLNEHNAQYR